MKEIIYMKEAIKGLKAIPKTNKVKMYKSFEMIAADDTKSLDIKKMKGTDFFRLRVGQYRAIYTIDLKVLRIEKVGPRGSIY